MIFNYDFLFLNVRVLVNYNNFFIFFIYGDCLFMFKNKKEVWFIIFMLLIFLKVNWVEN